MARTKQQLEEHLSDVATRVSDLLNPALSREAIIEELQELDEALNGESDGDEADEEDD